jgi:type VI secretion system protein ImpH
MTASADIQAETPAAYERRMRLFDSLAQEPWAHDFFALLREIDALGNGNPRLGTALRPGAEAVRLGQDPELDFAPAAVMSFRADAQRPPRIGVRFFGLFGPMGPLPLHFTEYARDRQRNHGDATFARFTDIFHHRALLLFYRAWAQCQPTVQADRPADDQFAKWVSALFGQAPQAFRGADKVPDVAKRFVAGHLARPTRNAESVSKVLRQYFKVPIRVQPHVGHWLALRAEDCTRLGRPGARRSAPLGVSAVAGSRVWDRQYKLRLHIGPLRLDQYVRFLPGQRTLSELRDWMRQLIGFDMVWDVTLHLQGAQVPPLQIGRGAATQCALGWTTWLGRGGRANRKHQHVDRSDLRLNPAQSIIRHSAKEQPHG